MIEINLIPEELKPKTKKGGLPFQGMEAKKALYFIPAVFALLAIAHISLAVALMSYNSRLRGLEKKWQGLAPQKKTVDALKDEYSMLSGDAKEIKRQSDQRINWAEKLNRLSLDLPAAVWLSEISLNGRNFNLKGAAVSLQKEEISFINKFLGNLKGDAVFFKDFNLLELASAQARVIGTQEVIDFVLNGTLK